MMMRNCKCLYFNLMKNGFNMLNTLWDHSSKNNNLQFNCDSDIIFIILTSAPFSSIIGPKMKTAE